MGGLLLTISCSHTEENLQRETQFYLTASNTVNSLQQAAPYVPPPTNPIFQGILAAGGALLALWATHIQRSVADLKNGKPNGQAQASTPRSSETGRLGSASLPGIAMPPTTASLLPSTASSWRSSSAAPCRRTTTSTTSTATSTTTTPTTSSFSRPRPHGPQQPQVPPPRLLPPLRPALPHRDQGPRPKTLCSWTCAAIHRHHPKPRSAAVSTPLSAAHAAPGAPTSMPAYRLRRAVATLKRRAAGPPPQPRPPYDPR